MAQYHIVEDVTCKPVEEEINELASQGWRLETFNVTQVEPAESGIFGQLRYTAVMAKD